MSWVTLRAALHAWVVACTGLSDQKVTWARQRNASRPEQDGIIMKIYVVDDEGGMPWVDVEDNLLTFADKTITLVSGSTLTITAHTLQTGDGPVRLVGADLPAPLTEDTDYWVIRTGADTIQLAAQFEDTGGDPDLSAGNPVTPIALTDAGSGSITLVDTDHTYRAGEEIQYVQRNMMRATLQLFSYVQDDTGEDGAIAILHRLSRRYKLPSNQQILQDANIGVTGVERVRSMLGVRDAVLFEPRAWVDISLSLTSEEREAGTIIGRTVLEQEEPDPTWTTEVENEEL